MNDVSFYMAFIAGVLSFLSPCVLPLVPSYVTYITGVSFEQLQSGVNRGRVRYLTIMNSLVFILGFSVIFIGLGAASSYVGKWLFIYKDWIRIIGGSLMIIFGLFISGIIKLDFLMKERKFHMKGKPHGIIGSFVIGMTFAAAWTPCIGPILGTILIKASAQGSVEYGLKLLAVYSAGLGVPFFIAAYMFNGFLLYSKAINRYMKVIMLISGLLLIAFGGLLLADRVRELAGYLPDFGLDI